MKKINHLISALIMAAMTAGVASCSSSDEPSSVSDNTPKELTITIKTQGVTTKAAASGTDPGTTAENTMNRITIGIFDNTGNQVRAIQEFSATGDNSLVGAGKNYFLNTTNGTATVTVVTTKMESNDKILVAVNAPEGKFAGISKADDFKNVNLTATQALYTKSDNTMPTDGIALSNNIPMFGEALITGTAPNFTATVTPKHLTAKVTLEELKVEFAPDGPYSAATFTPNQIFMYNVPDGLKFNDSDPFITSTFLTGEDKTATSDPLFLTTGDISSGATALKGTTAGGSNKFSNTYYFYITPNNDVTADNRTKLVIKGTFDPDGSGTTTSTVYYPVKLNSQVLADGTHSVVDGTTEYQVNPNKNYKCKVTIKTIGSTGPGIDIDPTTATITINVEPFSDVNQETVFQ